MSPAGEANGPRWVPDSLRTAHAPHDEASGAVLATAQRRHNRSLMTICRHLEDIGGLRDDVDARLASRIITYYYGIDGLLRTREVFGWSLERSNEWLLAHASAAVLRSPAGPLSPELTSSQTVPAGTPGGSS
jgi:hypothetical protein